MKFWEAVVQNKADSYLSIRERLFSDKKIEHLPVRALINGFGDEWDYDLKCIQLPIAPEVDGKEQTLESMMKYLTPEVVFDSITNQRKDNVVVLVQGLQLSMATPVWWMVEHCAHADEFVYVAVVKRA